MSETEKAVVEAIRNARAAVRGLKLNEQVLCVKDSPTVLPLSKDY